jgi:hypothetical protein
VIGEHRLIALDLDPITVLTLIHAAQKGNSRIKVVHLAGESLCHV